MVSLALLLWASTAGLPSPARMASPSVRAITLSLGTLYTPPSGNRSEKVPLVIHFHGDSRMPELAARQSRHPVAVLAIELGLTSDDYARPFIDPERFPRLVQEVSRRLNAPLGPITLSGFSAGYGAVRQILRTPANWDSIDTVILVDGMHAAYRSNNIVKADDVLPFVAFARQAVAGKKRMLVTHSEVFPGTYASTTETADFLLSCLGLSRHNLTRTGPPGIAQLSEVRQGEFRLLGFAGATGSDHFEQFQALANWWKLAGVWRAVGETLADDDDD